MSATLARRLGWFSLPDDQASPKSQPPRNPVSASGTAKEQTAVGSSDTVRRRAEQETADEAVARQITRYNREWPLPPLIRQFLNTHLRAYMTQLHRREGSRSEAWRTGWQYMEKLSWSVQPKLDDESRHQLYVLLPDLFQWLHFLLKARQVSRNEEDAFFAELATLQVDALHGREGAIGEAASVAPDGPLPGVAPTMKGTGNPVAGQHAGDEVGLSHRASRTGALSRAPGEESDTLDALVVGARMELRGERASRRLLRLEWISRGGGVYFFRDQERDDALCLTADRCKQYLRDGLASIH